MNVRSYEFSSSQSTDVCTSTIKIHIITFVNTKLSKSTPPANYSNNVAIELPQKQKFKDKIVATDGCALVSLTHNGKTDISLLDSPIKLLMANEVRSKLYLYTPIQGRR